MVDVRGEDLDLRIDEARPGFESSPEPLELACEPTSEICLDPIFGCRDTNLVQPQRLALGELLVSKLVERRTAPQRQLLGE